MSAASSSRGSGCFKIAAFGCGGLALVVVVAAVLVAINLDRLAETTIGRRITDAVNEGQEIITAVQALRPEIQKEFAVDRVDATMRFRSGRDRATLSLVLEAPPFLPEDAEGRERKAREVARFAARHFAAIDRVDSVVVRFEGHEAFVVGSKAAEEHEFPVAELLAPEDEPAADETETGQ